MPPKGRCRFSSGGTEWVMARVHDLLGKISDAGLREALAAEVKKLEKGKKFGLVFEEHLPEAASMPGVPIRAGLTVATRAQDGGALYFVKEVVDKSAKCVDELTGIEVEFALNDLVAVAMFGEAIYPYLQKVDEIEHGGGDLLHTLIQADNYHALQLLEYLYAGKVDCIYIDPPYNTGAKDWKYNNDYVDGNDAWRHSKWLSMMEKRLKIAKRLLNPKDSVLIVTIDEKEYLHLGILLEQMFPEARIQMVTSVISAKGVVRAGQFSRIEEYIFIIGIGKCSACQTECNMLDDEVKKEAHRDIEWLGFRRRAPQAKRASRPNQFYPVFVSKDTGHIHSIGDVVRQGVDRNTIVVPSGCVAMWPLSSDGDERLWSLIPHVARENWKKGYLRIKNWDKESASGTVYYLASGTIADIEEGRATVTGRNPDGSVIATCSVVGDTPPKRVWNLKSHNAETYGTNLIQSIIGANRFTYPKSLYAVHDAIRFFVANKPNALILDFFAGSGTTLHAVNLLNAEDGGKRRCIMVTNNEVSEDEAKAFRKAGLKPGDTEWEAKGIAQYVTWPRTVCSIKGVDVKGAPLKGTYLGGDKDNPRQMADGFQSNAAFFRLGFTERETVENGLNFAEMVSVLWMKSGAVGKCPEVDSEDESEMLLFPENGFAVLLDAAAFVDFRKAVNKDKRIQYLYFVEGDGEAYAEMAARFKGRETCQLFGDYVNHFRIAARRNG